MMNDADWYTFQDKKQLGPFPLNKIQDMYRTKMISQVAYVFKSGWKDWRPIAECQQELGLSQSDLPPPPPGEMRKLKDRAPRACVDGQIIIHDHEQMTIGLGINISPSGIFVETDQKLFNVGETVRLTCKVRKMSAPFQTKAEVIRYSNDRPQGYGLKFERLDKKVVTELKFLVEQENKKLGKAG